jgi:hypothetical protein
MDYKILIQATQQQAGDEDAKLSISYGGATVASEVPITSTDDSNPTNVVFEITGAPASGDSTSIDLVCTLVNDYYVDSSTDRRITLQGVYYTDKADSTNYKRWNQTTGVWDIISTFDSTTMMLSQFEAVSGDDQPSDFLSGQYVILYSDPATITINLTGTSGMSGDYPASEENPK